MDEVSHVPATGATYEDPRYTLSRQVALIEAGKVPPVIDRTYPLSETAAAIAYVGLGHARGKVVICA
jgi:NADPH:quinone reductase-like Zn-dependent oxidoreductase